MKITLASTSKFKNNILDTVHIRHDQISPNTKEDSIQKDPYLYVKEIAKQKLDSVSSYDTDILISLDTIVLIENQIIEKPKSIEEAIEIFEDSKGTHFEPCIVKAVINIKDKIAAIDQEFKTSEEQTNAKEKEWWHRYHSKIKS
jgi:predicted house-cleaning NTP pyrophosphatase (Maf/HAM1 superfamily)